ncbi:glycosyltransferase family 2 protein [Klenkia sp. PcliD-1-E]|uniref:glycosyltransferase n=1 Tax=Klenkia sp. PcliD-1-E TaxID=2954492 RepID=UPI002097E354|nr:glycosyltransferase family A protein [Klenkia sp. PcliD-1-E]MCO7220218.1 glycosyltransferase family 2 protein [Klenkia sp. PcliD-1-E]
MGDPVLSLVVSTVGRPTEFARLVDSLVRTAPAGQVELVVCDQSADQSCATLLGELDPPLPWRTTTSGRGASVGRNAGLQLARGDLLGFPDDNCWFPAGALHRVLATFAAEPGLAGLCGQQQTPDGRPSMLRWPDRGGPVTRTNFMKTSIMSTMFFPRARLDRVGGFDEGMGVGSAGWYGAGEESDLLLRVLDDGGTVRYDPALVVLQDEPRDAADDRFVAKMLRYGCGNGHLWRLHRLPRWLLAWYCARKAVGAGVRLALGRRSLARADLAYLRGTWAGWVDRRPRDWPAGAGS